MNHEHSLLAAQWISTSAENCFNSLQINLDVALTAPHVLMRPAIFPDGNKWCALYGKDLQEGVCGFGETPSLAAADFDKNWRSQNIAGDDK